MLFFSSVAGSRLRENSRDSARAFLTLVLLVGAWEADHVLNFVTVGRGGGGALIG